MELLLVVLNAIILVVLLVLLRIILSLKNKITAQIGTPNEPVDEPPLPTAQQPLQTQLRSRP